MKYMALTFRPVLIFFVILAMLLAAAPSPALIGAPGPDEPAASEMDGKLISVYVNGTPYIISDAADNDGGGDVEYKGVGGDVENNGGGNMPAVFVTDEVFKLSIEMKNTGTAKWGQERNRGDCENAIQFMLRFHNRRRL